MKRMHNQLLFWGVRPRRFLVAHPQEFFVVARASLQSALIPLGLPFLVPADPQASVRNVIPRGGAEGTAEALRLQRQQQK